MRRYHKNSNGFTMAEMLITVAIIVILCGFGFVAVIAHQRNLKRMEMDETAQEIFIAAQNHLTAARASGQWSSFLEKTAAEGQDGSRGTAISYERSDYDKASDADAASRKFYYFTTENTAVKNGAEALILPEGSIDETLRGHHFYVEYDASSGTVFGVFYTDSDHAITADDAQKVSRTEPNDRRDYKADGKRTIIGYYGGALGELNSPGDLYAPSVAVRNAESLVLYVVDKNYYRPVSSKTGAQSFQTKLKLTIEGVTSGEKAVKEVDLSNPSSQTDAFSSAVLAEESDGTFNVVIPSSGASAQQTKAVKAEYYAIVLDSIVRKDGHFANLFPEFIPGEDIRITVTLTSDKAGEDVSQTVTVNSLFNSVKTEKDGIAASKTVVTVSNPRHLENLSSEVSGVDFEENQIVKDTTVDTVSVVRNLFWDEDAEAENVVKAQDQKEMVTAFLPAIASATGMESPFGYYADGNQKIAKGDIQVYSYTAKKFGTGAVTSEDTKAQISKGACYGITNTAIQTFEGNNHMLAAFRFEGMQEAALINRAAAVLKVSDLVIADATSCVTGEVLNTSDGGNAEMPTAALLIAKANSGYAENNGASVENVQIVWYPEGANKNGLTTENSAITAATDAKGTMVYSENGIASLLIGSIDADHKLSVEEGQTAQQGEPTKKFTIKNVTIQAGNFNAKKTVNVGVEGNIAAGMIGEIRSGAVTIDGSKESGDADTSENNWKTRCKINGKLTLNAMKGTDPVAGGLIGKVADTVTNQEDLILQKVYLEADTLQMNGLRKEGQSIGILGGLIGSVEGRKSVKAEEADLIAKNVNIGIAENSQEWNAGTAGGIIGSVTEGTKTELKNVRFTSVNSRLGGKQAVGGVIGNFASGEGTLESVHVLATGQNENAAEDNSGKTTKNFRDLNITVGQEQPSLTVTADQTVMNSSAGGFFGAVTDSSSQLSIRKSSLKTISMDAKSMGTGESAQGTGNADLTVTGTNVGGLIGYCAGKATTIGDTNSNDGVILTVQGSFTLGENGKKAGNAGGLIGKIGNSASGGTNVSVAIQNVPLTVRTMTAYAEGTNGKEGTVGGFIGNAATNVSGITLKDCNLSANSVNLGAIETASENAVKAVGGAIGRISSGKAVLENLTVLTSKADTDCGEGAEDNYIKVTASQGKAGGLVGVAESGTESLQIANAAVSGSGTNDQIEAGSSAGGLAGETQAAATSISNSMASMYVRSEGNGGNVGGSSSTDGAGGLIGSASGTVTIQNSYSGGRTTGGKYADSTDGKGRYNVCLQKGTGAAGGVLGKMLSGSLNVTNVYSTSSVAVLTASTAEDGTDAGGFVGHVTNLTAENTYCTGRVYATNSASTTPGATPHYGTYAGKLTSFSGSKNYYLGGIKGATDNAIGTLNGNSDPVAVKQNVSNILNEADYNDNDSALRKDVPSDQKTYCYDTALEDTTYPLKNVTTAPAHTVYDPNTGDKVTGESADGNQYAQIGDWEIPEKQSLEGAYGLIYYERVQGDDTFYYHGYMLASGDSIQNAVYTEVSNDGSSDPFLHDAGKYVVEDGYLLLIKKEINNQENLQLGFGRQESSIYDIKGDIINVRDLEKCSNSITEIGDYNSYFIDMPVQKMWETAYLYTPSSNSFGIAVSILLKKAEWNWDAKAAFTFIPFFADTVTAPKKAPDGQWKLQSVSKEKEINKVIIRSARQLKYLAEYDNYHPESWYGGYLKGTSVVVTVEQQMDITFDSSKVIFMENGEKIKKENNPEIYQSPTFKYITNLSVYQSSRRKGSVTNDYYILDGLTNPFVDTVDAGYLCHLQVTNIKAPYFIRLETGGQDIVSISDIHIKGAVFGTGEQYDEKTDAGFIVTVDGRKIDNCSIENAIIHGNGFVKNVKTNNTSTINNCYIKNAIIDGNGFVEENELGNISQCNLINVEVRGNGFAKTNSGKISDSCIKNAIIAENGFAEENNGRIENCGISSDPSLYPSVVEEDNYSQYYHPYTNGNAGEYDYVAIGITPAGTKNSENIAGFVNKQRNSQGNGVYKCFVTGHIYGSGDVSGFVCEVTDRPDFINCYSNVIIDAGGKAAGFSLDMRGRVIGCHALGTIYSEEEAYGFAGTTAANISDCYEAFWSIKGNGWYPFFKTRTEGTVSKNFYLTECSINTDSGVANTNGYVSGQVDGKTYVELCNLSIDGLLDQAAEGKTVGYYKYMPNDSTHSVYPYPMPEGMTAYGDWSYYHLGAASLVYYERIGDQYYLHGVTADANGTEYMTIPGTLLNETGKTVTEDGYLLILKNAGGNGGEYSIGFSSVNGKNASEQYTVGTADADKAFVRNDTLTSAMKNALGINQECTVYQFDPTNYVKLNKDGFSALDTYAQYSGGVGLTVTQGSNLMAKFSFLPIFADTVTAPTVQNVNGKTEISFASVQKDAAQDGADYIIRSARQLKLLSDWDADSWKNNFDKDLAKRYSYLSSTNTGYKNHLVIRQDMDIQAPDTNRILFGNIDGTYKGQAYTVTGESTAKPVKLSGLTSDFAEKIAPSGTISSLVVEDAAYRIASEDEARPDKISASNDLNSEDSNEFVRYNHGTISDVTIQNSKLGTGGLVYQNEYAKPSENAGDDYKSGVIQNCVIRNSDVKGAGLVWKNLGGSITDSSVENCKTGFAGFVQKNMSKDLGKDADGNAVYAKAVVDSCSVRNIVTAGNGFAGNNTGVELNAQLAADEQAVASSQATIRNCSVVNGVISGYGFAYENEKNGLIENCQIYGDKSQYEEYLTEAATWTGGQEKRRYYPYTDQSAQRKAAYELVTLTVKGDFYGAGFAESNDENCVIANCSVTGTIDWKNKKNLAGFINVNKGNITGSYNNVIMGSKDNNASGKASGFVNKNEGSISFCHTLGTIEGNSQIAGFTMENSKGEISCSYSAMWSYNANNYSYFSPDKAGGAFTFCYALSKSNGTEANGITKVTAETLKSKTVLSGVTAGTEVKTVAYGQLNAGLNETSEYPFPCGSSIITNYGDWQENVTASGKEKTVTLLAGSNAAFAGEAIPALMSEEMADEDILQEEGPREIQAVLEEDETELNLSEFVPQMKGWKLLGWLITSPSELSASEKTTTVSDVVTKINKLSDGDAEASGSSKAVYELETGTKSYHYAPDAVITVTEDMTLSAVWVPDDDTVEKAKDGTLRMDENGNILEDENEAESTGNAEASADPSSIAGTTETPEEGAKESSTAGTTETPEAGTTEPSTAGTTETPEEGTTESATTGTTESPEEGATESSTTGTTEMSETGATESTELSSSGTETSAENGGGTCYEIYQAEY